MGVALEVLSALGAVATVATLVVTIIPLRIEIGDKARRERRDSRRRTKSNAVNGRRSASDDQLAANPVFAPVARVLDGLKTQLVLSAISIILGLLVVAAAAALMWPHLTNMAREGGAWMPAFWTALLYFYILFFFAVGASEAVAARHDRMASAMTAVFIFGPYGVAILHASRLASILVVAAVPQLGFLCALIVTLRLVNRERRRLTTR